MLFKGIIQQDGYRGAGVPTQDIDPEDDASTKFYKSRFKKSTVADMKGRTPIYDFDEWSRQHYGKSFERRNVAKAKFERQEAQKRDQVFKTQNEVLLLCLSLVCVMIYVTFLSESAYDTPKQKAERKAADDLKKSS